MNIPKMNNSLILFIKKSIALAVFIVISLQPYLTFAQVEVDTTRTNTYQVDQFILGSSFAGALSIGQLDENLPNTVGFTISALTKLSKNNPVHIGFSTGFYNYERYNTFYFTPDDEGFLFEVEETTKVKLFNLHGVVRLQPFIDFFIHPYVEGYVGGKHFYVRTTVTDVQNPEDDLTNDGRGGDWAISVGGALGFNIPFYTTDEFGLELDVKGVFVKGSDADYSVLREDLNSTNIIDTFDAFETRNSATDLIIPQIGLIIYFGI